METKLKSAIKFLSANQKVNIKLEFKRRELAHQGIGFKVLNSFLDELKEFGNPIGKPKSEGKSLFCAVEPKEENDSKSS
jgi:translation initiation factor IF-3